MRNVIMIKWILGNMVKTMKKMIGRERKIQDDLVQMHYCASAKVETNSRSCGALFNVCSSFVGNFQPVAK
jgi:hypothetical protein